MDDNELYAQAEHDERHAKLRRLEITENLLREVYRQAGNSAPTRNRHALTPSLRDDIRDYIKEHIPNGFKHD